MRKLVLSLAIVMVLAGIQWNRALAQTSPQFVLGFKTIADMIPNVVGRPVENEHFNPQNGDSLQRTTTGMMVWRKADNFTAFTDGSNTWINGPYGLQARPNNARFPWESTTPAQPAPSPQVLPAPPPTPPAPPTTTSPSPHPGNWSGYVTTRFSTGQSYTSVSASWTVPAAKAPAGVDGGFSATWIGIGGACLDAQCSDTDPSLIQIGTDQNAAHGNTEYGAWYEMLPGVSIPITSVTVRPGDRMSAQVQMVGGSAGSVQTWQLTLTNNTTGQNWSQTVQYQSSLASADWIEEAPFAGEVLPLADFGTVTISQATANGAAARLDPAQRAIMLNPFGQIGNTSVPSGRGDSFNVCFATPNTIEPCNPPS